MLAKKTYNGNRDIKRYSRSLIIRKKQIKVIMGYHFTPVRIAIFKKTINIIVVKNVEKGTTCAVLVGIQIGAATKENSMEISQKIKHRTTHDSAIPLLSTYPRKTKTLMR